MSDKLTLHEDSRSGNCYKVRLTAAFIGVHLIRHEYDIMKGETRTPDFVANINPHGRIPVLQVGDRFIPESNAACYFIAEGSNLVPTDPFDHADMLRWMFFEQYSHEPHIATLRFWMCWLGPDNLSDMQRLQMPGKRQAGNEALKLMDGHLASREWFVGDSLTLADICLFAYTDLAGDAGYDLGRYPHVGEWLERLKGQPRYIPMDT